ncbi:MAG: sensor histidine kinase [Sciscionella sp.]
MNTTEKEEQQVVGREHDPSRSDVAGRTRPTGGPPSDWSATDRDDAVASVASGERHALVRAERASGGGGWRLRQWRLRTKLIAVLLIPAVLALVFAGLRVASDVSSATGLAKLSVAVQLESKVNNLVQQLQRERDLSVLFVASGHIAERRALGTQTTKVDNASNAFQQALNKDAGKLTPDAAHRMQGAVAQLDQLPYLRNAIQGSKYPAEATEQAYSRFLAPLLNIGDQAIATINSPDLTRLQLANNAIARVKEAESQRRALLLEVFRRGKASGPLQRAVQGAESQRTAALTNFQKFATPTQRNYYTSTATGQLVDEANEIVETAISRAGLGQPLTTDVQHWDNVATVSIDLIYQVQQATQNQLAGRTDQLAAAAKRSAIIDASVVLGALVLAVLMALFVARSLLLPLRTLRRSALEMAEFRLPEEVERILADSDPVVAAGESVQAVPVHTREEVGQVARAFDAVHAEAVRLAAEQALLRDSVNSMFVNLSRRSQTLVERQLSLIDRLEADEQDPDQLSNLFELDHLATRMRRNSENLLVLSGTELGRRMTRPVPVTDVLTAAVSEVEQYARVDLAASPDLTLPGRAVNDVVHLVAELLDNATLYSDPQTSVSVRSARTRAGALSVEIGDSGVGMSNADIILTNERLADPPELDVGVSRRMGLYVVARLAKRHNIRVTLRENEEAGGGVVARVLVPSTLVIAEGEQAPAAPPAVEAASVSRKPPTSAAPAAGIAGAFGVAGSRNGAPAESPLETTFAGTPRRGPRPEAEPVVAQAREAPEPAPEDRAAAAAPENVPAGVRRAPVAERGSGAEAESEQAVQDSNAPTERLPIYEAVLSQWFAAESEPVTGTAAVATTATTSAARPAAREPARVAAAASGGEQLPSRVPGKATLPRRQASEAPPVAEPHPPMQASDWNTPADAGWQAVQALENKVEQVTSNGLPKRKPRAHLVPGSAAQRPQPQPATGAANAPAAPPRRSADAVRGKMSSLQQGVRRGRHALAETYAGDGRNSSGDDEEHQ